MLTEFWHYFSENRGAVIGLAVFAVLVVAALLAPLISDPTHSAVLLDVDGTPVFVKQVRLTDLERRPENLHSTRNLFELRGIVRFARLRERGAHVQRPLWASTSTKNPEYRDVLYVEELIGPDTVNTMPLATVPPIDRVGTR